MPIEDPASNLQLPMRAMSLLFPIGKEPLTIRSLLVGTTNDKENGFVIGFNTNWNWKTKEPAPQGSEGHISCHYNPDATLEDVVNSCERSKAYIEAGCPPEFIELYRTAVRIILAVCLLDKDPDLILPDFNTTEQIIWDAADAERRKELLALALARPRSGWTIGAGIEHCPHIRRGHLFLCPCGAGRRDRKIRWRKGSVVHRSKIVEIPTGYAEPPQIAT